MKQLKMILEQSRKLQEKLLEEKRDEDAAVIESLMKMADLFVETPYGTFYPEKSGDPDYPGIFISIEHHSGFNEALALVEHRLGENDIRTLAWQGDHDDYVSNTTNYDESIEENVRKQMESYK